MSSPVVGLSESERPLPHLAPPYVLQRGCARHISIWERQADWDHISSRSNQSFDSAGTLILVPPLTDFSNELDMLACPTGGIHLGRGFAAQVVYDDGRKESLSPEGGSGPETGQERWWAAWRMAVACLLVICVVRQVPRPNGPIF